MATVDNGMLSMRPSPMGIIEIRIIPKDEIFKIFELIIKNRYFKHNLFSELKSLF